MLYFQDIQQKRYRCSVLKTKSSYLEFEVLKEVPLEKPNFFSLFIPYLKNKEIESLLFKATEMGVDKLLKRAHSYSLLEINIADIIKAAVSGFIKFFPKLNFK